jgi:hypothetical protein
MRTLSIEQMEQIEGGSKALSCANLAAAAGIASIETGPFSFLVAGFTFLGCYNS